MSAQRYDQTHKVISKRVLFSNAALQRLPAFSPSGWRPRALFVTHEESEPEAVRTRGGNNSCVLGGAVSALIASVLLTAAALLVYSSGDIAVTFIQRAPAAASPQEAQRRPHADHWWPTERRASPVWVGRHSLLGKFCWRCRKARGGGSGGTALILRAGWAFPLLLPVRKHILLFLPSVFASGGKEVR